jgi:flagellar basal-body rod protein FlgB
MSVTPSQFDTLRQMLQVSNLRHTVIAQNLANVNTPGYEAREVPFEQEMSRLVGRGSGSFDQPEGLVRVAVTSHMHQDGNTVDVNREIGNLNHNALMHQAYLQILATKLSQMKTAITGR